jgi:hypothetical protein
MDCASLKALVARELERGDEFDNLHGVNSANVRSFLVEPFTVLVDPDDLETKPREMWVVLQERGNPAEGHVIVYDAQFKSWAVAEHVSDGKFVAVVAAPTLAGALEGM